MPAHRPTRADVAASAVLAALERAWTAIRSRHGQVPEVIVILGACDQPFQPEDPDDVDA